jgi:hypothetical protein
MTEPARTLRLLANGLGWPSRDDVAFATEPYEHQDGYPWLTPLPTVAQASALRRIARDLKHAVIAQGALTLEQAAEVQLDLGYVIEELERGGSTPAASRHARGAKGAPSRRQGWPTAGRGAWK